MGCTGGVDYGFGQIDFDCIVGRLRPVASEEQPLPTYVQDFERSNQETLLDIRDREAASLSLQKARGEKQLSGPMHLRRGVEGGRLELQSTFE